MTKIIITGGAGFVGSTLCLQLKAKYPKYKIVAFDNLRRRGSELNLIDFKLNNIDFIHDSVVTLDMNISLMVGIFSAKEYNSTSLINN